MPYTGIACPDMKRDGACARGELCPYAHNVFEYWLHPTRYRTQLCNDGDGCKRRVCFFAHTASQLRVPDSKPFVNPQALAAATAAAAARRPSSATEAETYDLVNDKLAGMHLQSGNDTAKCNGWPRDTMHAQAQDAPPPSSDNCDAQIAQLLIALLCQNEGERNSMQTPNMSRLSKEQLATLCHSLSVRQSLSQAAKEVSANGSTKIQGHLYNTPRSSLDLSGLRDFTSSDRTDSCRSSFETQQGLDGRRVSQEVSRADSGSFGAHGAPRLDGRQSLEGTAEQSTAYEVWAANQTRLLSQDSGGIWSGNVAANLGSDRGRKTETDPLGEYLTSSGRFASGALAAASSQAGLVPTFGSMTSDQPLRRASFDVAPGSYVNLSGDSGYLRTGDAPSVYNSGFVPSRYGSIIPNIASIGSDTMDTSAGRSKSLPNGLSISQFGSRGPDICNSFRGGHLQAVTEGVPFAYSGFEPDYGNAIYANLMTQDATVAAPATNPMWQLPETEEVCTLKAT